VVRISSFARVYQLQLGFLVQCANNPMFLYLGFSVFYRCYNITKHAFVLCTANFSVDNIVSKVLPTVQNSRIRNMALSLSGYL